MLTKEEIKEMSPVQLKNQLADMTLLEIASLIRDLADIKVEKVELPKKIAITQAQFEEHFYISENRGRPCKYKAKDDISKLRPSTKKDQEEFRNALLKK